MLSFAFAAFALLQLVVTIINSKSSSAQIERIIVAADRIEDAAGSFAGSAAHINNGVSDAVGQLHSQATAAENSRISSERNAQASLQATIDDFRQDQRPWVGLQTYTCINCSLGLVGKIDPKTGYVPPNESFSIGGVTGLIANTGKTPAVDVTFNAALTGAFPKQGIPSWRSIKARAGISDTHIGVMPPGYHHDYALAPSYQTQRLRTFPSGSLVIYVVGEITYFDVNRKNQFTTDFCLMDSTWFDGQSFVFCPEGNDMR